MSLRVGLVGATGVVGQIFIQLLEERNFPILEFRPFASERRLGQTLLLNEKSWPLEVLSPDCFKNLDLVFFSSGDEVSAQWAPLALKAGAYVIDNSASFRMNPEIHLIVPEINGDKISSSPQIIANPNCSTIQLVLVLDALRKLSPLVNVHVATYQSVSGAGQGGIDELDHNILSSLKSSQPPEIKVFPHNIAFNVIPHIGSFSQNGFCSEEMKIMLETRKILNEPHLMISAFTVRVPVKNGHSEAVWVEFKDQIPQKDLVQALSQKSGLTFKEQTNPFDYPLPSQISGKNDVFVGRLHPDLFNKNKWILWIVADNLRKGAALNGLQIAEKIFLRS